MEGFIFLSPNIQDLQSMAIEVKGGVKRLYTRPKGFIWCIRQRFCRDGRTYSHGSHRDSQR